MSGQYSNPAGSLKALLEAVSRIRQGPSRPPASVGQSAPLRLRMGAIQAAALDVLGKASGPMRRVEGRAARKDVGAAESCDPGCSCRPSRFGSRIHARRRSDRDGDCGTKRHRSKPAQESSYAPREVHREKRRLGAVEPDRYVQAAAQVNADRLGPATDAEEMTAARPSDAAVIRAAITGRKGHPLTRLREISPDLPCRRAVSSRA